MAFPQTALPIKVELNLNSVWTDISTYVYERDEINIRRGRSDWAGEVDPGLCSLTLDNRDGRFSPRKPTGAYYGSIGRNTPIRVSVETGETYLSLPGAAADQIETPDAAALDITGDIDIRMEYELTLPFDATSSVIELAGKYETTGDQRSWFLTVREGGLLDFSWSPDGTLASRVTAFSTKGVSYPPGGRIAVRVTLDVNNGAAGKTVTFYTAPDIDGTWTQLGDAVTTAGTTSIFSSTAELEIGSLEDLAGPQLAGKAYAFKLYNGIGGTLVANPDFTAQTAGATSFVDSTGLTWTVQGAATITNKKIRFLGEVSSWNVEWDTGGNDVTTRIEAQGVRRRLSQGNGPLQSTLRRKIPTDPSLVAYWPMEEGSEATHAFSPIAGVRPMTTHKVSFSSDDTLEGSDSLPTLAGATGDLAQFIGKVPTHTLPASEWRVECVFNIDTIPATLFTLLRITTGRGFIREWYIQIEDTGGRILGRDEDGTTFVSSSFVWGADGAPQGDWHRLAFTNDQDGINLDWEVNFIKVDESSTSHSGTVIVSTIGPVTAVSGPPAGFSTELNGLSIGHVAVFTDFDTTIFNFADHGYNEELAGDRLLRLVEEEGISLAVYGQPDDTERMGSQLVEELLTLLQEGADADHGILYEARESAALAFLPRAAIYDQPVTLTLNYAGSDGLVAPLGAPDDDQLVRNSWTVQRQDAATALAELETGALSILAPPNGIGKVNDQRVLNLASDIQAEHAASWLLHQTTWDESRYPAVRVLLQNATGKIETASAMDVGMRMQITNPPDWLPPETIDLIAQGYTETIHQFRWELEFNCIPAGPFTAAHVAATSAANDTVAVRVDTAGTTLNEDLTTTETLVDIVTSGDYRWADSATFASDFPFDIMVGGERMTVTACTGTGLTQTFTCTRSVNGVVKTHASGANVVLFNPPIAVL